MIRANGQHKLKEHVALGDQRLKKFTNDVSFGGKTCHSAIHYGGFFRVVIRFSFHSKAEDFRIKGSQFDLKVEPGFTSSEESFLTSLLTFCLCSRHTVYFQKTKRSSQHNNKVFRDHNGAINAMAEIAININEIEIAN